MRKRFIPSLLLATLLAGSAQAATVSDSLRTTVYYRTASARLELPYMDNARHLSALGDSIRALEADPAAVLRRIRIQSSASPEGNSKFNKELARKRGEELRDYLKGNLSLPDSIFTLQSLGEGWDELAEKLARTDVPWRDKALAIIRDTPEWVVREGKVVDGRKRQLMNLSGGRAWQYMMENLFDSLRSGALVVCEVERMEQVKPEPEPTSAEVRQATDMTADNTEETPSTEPESTATLYNKEDETVPQDNTEVGNGGKPFFMAVKTNLLYDAALVPNVGLEFYLGKGWSVCGDWMHAWWSKDAKHRYWRVYGGELEVRKYFGRKAAEKPLQGHHLGVYAQGLTYDFETGGKGYLSDFGYGVGVEYGYSLPVAKRLNIDFGLGVGYGGGKYKVYDPEDGCYVYKETKKRRWFGPTKAEISLVWLLGHGNENKKGGTK
ncbi:DUF3575 domain-containing protein [Phocaeicola vulgatus]|uniref:DUF3575 domain-containing protein n=1 Tax=Phocaeicola vulgatus TaxID=821 RepID=A0A3E4JRB5_PHOVU|nr:DUF3575 domain-containing protein [Phocaeicola vulgatus]RGJ89527.1 DUF3575 domain-containing protein [Phocaeicola vulgatus]